MIDVTYEAGKIIHEMASNNFNAKERPTIGDGKLIKEDGFVPKRNQVIKKQLL